MSALIPIKLSWPDQKVKHVATATCPWVGPSFSKHLLRTRKAYWYLSLFEKQIPTDLCKIIKSDLILTLEILSKIRQSFLCKLIKIPNNQPQIPFEIYKQWIISNHHKIINETPNPSKHIENQMSLQNMKYNEVIKTEDVCKNINYHYNKSVQWITKMTTI